MIYKVFIVLVIFKMASSMPDSSVSVNVNVNADSENGKDQQKDPMYECPCKAIHGQCIDKDDTCPNMKPIGVAGPPCKDPSMRCCYPKLPICPQVCLETMGCFFYYPSSQCFCMIAKPTARSYNSTCAKEECTKKNMLLPHPNCAVGLRSVAVQQWGDCGPFWTSAMYYDKQDSMVWADTCSYPGHKVEITTNDPLISPPVSFASGQCLVMSASYATMEDGKPYSVKNCDDEIQDQHHILCQKVW